MVRYGLVRHGRLGLIGFDKLSFDEAGQAWCGVTRYGGMGLGRQVKKGKTMSIMNLNKPAETETQPIFILRGVSYLPHYIKSHKWVGPGREHERKEYTTTELMEAGARLSTMQLWKRSWTNELKGWRIL